MRLAKSPKHIVENYTEIRYDYPINRLFFEHGQESFLKAVTRGLTKNDDIINNTLKFILESLKTYRKKDWNESLGKLVRNDVSDLIRSSNYFNGKLATDILRELAGDDPKKLEELYEGLQKVFQLHFDLGKDPMLLYHAFSVLNTRNGGTWVYEYEVEMISQLFNHPLNLMKMVGIGCFEIMNPDQDEIAEELFQQFEKLKEQHGHKFFGLILAFEAHMKRKNQLEYTIEELDHFITHTYNKPD